MLIVFFCTFCLQSAFGAERTDRVGKKLKKIPLRVTSIPDPKSTTSGTKVALALLEEFQRRNPDIELSQFSGISIANIGWESKLMLAIAGGAAPDILPLNFRMSDTYIQQNFMYPLDDYVNKDFGGIKKYLATIPPAVRPVLYREGPAIGPFKAGMHIWGLNSHVSTRALFWRKDLFQDVGLDPEKPPRTWEEFLNYARVLSDPGKDRYGMNVYAGDQGAWDFLPYLWGAGGEAVVQDKDGKWRAAFGSREAAIGLDFYLKLITERWVDADGVVQHGYTTANADKRSVTLALQAG
ncbi:MAG: extracellular solute-binding protein, partial [Lentisphaeria bacterium]|nr:extracellular solute-binding protein [Lentisphaeria bacterium]